MKRIKNGTDREWIVKYSSTMTICWSCKELLPVPCGEGCPRCAATLYLFRYTDNYAQAFLHRYSIIEQTPKGFWIEHDRCGLQPLDKKWVGSSEHGTHFAYSTKHAALYSYMRRKRRQVRILVNQLSVARERLEWAEGELRNEESNY